MDRRRRRELSDIPGAPCQLCEGPTVIAQSRAVRSGLALVNPRWDPDIRVYELCRSCGAKRQVGEQLSA